MRLRALGCAVAIHAGGVAFVAGNPFWGLAICAGGVAMLRWGVVHLVVEPDWRLEGRRGGYALATFSLLSVLWLLLQSQMSRYGGGEFGIPGKERAMRVETADPPADVRSAAEVQFDKTHPGVVVYSEEQTRAIVPPAPRAVQSSRQSARSSKPREIPFYGAYWLFQPPQQRPPENSFVTRGRPSAMRFRSSDQTPLRMEARQNLGRLIDLSCCSRIQLALSSADHYPGSVEVELILVNTALPGAPSQSLGSFPMRAFAGHGGWEKAETLSFRIPATSAIRSFDELRIVFHLGRVREDRSARIAIDRFMLLPRGL